jgi:MFS family permease
MVLDVDNNEVLVSSNGTNDTHLVQEETPKGRRCFGILGYVLNLGVLNILLMTSTVYNMSVVRTLEKRFGLTSTETGIMWSLNDVTHIGLVVFAGYFGRKSHKPKIISFTMAFAAVGTFLMMAPYFIFPLEDEFSTVANVTVSAPRSRDPLFCVSNSTQGDDKCIDDNGERVKEGRHPAFYVFAVAQLLCGVGGCAIGALGLAYIDENSPKNKVSIYIGENDRIQTCLCLMCDWGHHCRHRDELLRDRPCTRPSSVLSNFEIT